MPTLLHFGQDGETLGDLAQHCLEAVGMLARLGDLFVELAYRRLIPFLLGEIAELGIHLRIRVGFAATAKSRHFTGSSASRG